MKGTGGRFTTVCEIDCGSGLVFDHLSRTLEGPHQYLGLDMSPRQVEMNRRRFDDRRPCFEAGEGLTWVLRNGRRGSIFGAKGGVLEYFPPRRLQAPRGLGGRTTLADVGRVPVVRPTRGRHGIGGPDATGGDPAAAGEPTAHPTAREPSRALLCRCARSAACNSAPTVSTPWRLTGS